MPEDINRLQVNSKQIFVSQRFDVASFDLFWSKERKKRKARI